MRSILQEHPFEHGGLARTRLPQDIHMHEPVRLEYAKRRPLVAKVCGGKVGNVGIHATTLNRRADEKKNKESVL